MSVELSIGTGPTRDDALSAVTSAEVYERVGEPTRFVLRYDSPLVDDDFPLASNKQLDAGSVLWIVAPFSNVNHVLAKGPVLGQRMSFEHGGFDDHLGLRHVVVHEDHAGHRRGDAHTQHLLNEGTAGQPPFANVFDEASDLFSFHDLDSMGSAQQSGAHHLARSEKHASPRTRRQALWEARMRVPPSRLSQRCRGTRPTEPRSRCPSRTAAPPCG